MATLTKNMTKEEIFQLKNRLSPFILKESTPQYTYYQIKTKECSITAYTSGKVVFQGADLSWLEPKQTNSEAQDQAGSDEVGSILIVPNTKYNDMHDTCNMVDMKCRLHNQAYVNLVHKGYTLPKQIVIDQFVQEKSYYRYLQGFPEVIRGITFETKAENKYLAVACASILARNAFLETWDLMEEKYDFKFEKGAGSKVDVCGKKFVQKFGKEKLYQVAKLHFKNTQKIGV